MAEFILTNQAVEDLSEIWNFTFTEWSEVQADFYYSMIIESCQGLANGRLTGKTYAEIQEGIFGLRAGQHVVFYKTSDKGEVVIIRILHGRMDLKTRMME